MIKFKSLFAVLLTIISIAGANAGGFSLLHVGSADGNGASVSFLLDTLSVSSVSAYSTRKLRSAYAGSALRVIRSSDSAQSDIGFAANGQLDSTMLSSFCAATSCFVVTWYDQSGSAVDASSVGGNPRIVNAGAIDTLNSNPAIRFGVVAGAAINFNTASGSTVVVTPMPSSIAIAAKLNSVVTNSHYTDGFFGNPRELLGQNNAGAYQIFAGGAPSTGGTVDLLSHAVIGTFNTGGSTLYIDGTLITSLGVGTNGIGRQVIGGGDGTSGTPTAIDGWIGEYLVFASNLNSTDRAIIKTSWQTQWGTQ